MITVYPIHIITLVIALLYFPINILKYGKGALVQLLLNVFLLQDFSTEKTTGNWVSWYLCVYLLFALITPLVIKIIDGSLSKAGIIVFASLVIRYLLEAWNQAGYFEFNFHYSPVIRSLEFIAALSIGCIFVKARPIFQKKVSNWVWLIVEIFVICLYIISNRYAIIRFWHVLLSLLLVGALFLEISFGLINRLSNNIFIRLIADVQLEFYLFHQIVIRIMRYYCPDIRKRYLVLIGFFITMGCAYSYKMIIKKPCENVMKRVLNKIEEIWMRL